MPPLTFTCTLCWTPSPPPSHIVGSPRSARLACAACYAALLDLAVCWVCGELVVRGDECVSLGWCFWHRACYGCLVCGCRILVRGVGVGDVFEGGVVGGCGGGCGVDFGRGKGREVEEVPLCGRCVLEVDGEEVKALGEGRWEGGGVRRGLVGTDGAQEDGEGAEWMDGEGRYAREEGGERFAGQEGMFYVSMSDPMGRPGFRPSRMKPIPVWMHPFRRRDGGGQRHRDAGLLSTRPRKSASSGPRDSQIPGMDGPGSTADSDTSLEHPSALVEPLRLPRSGPAKLVTENVNASLSSVGTYHTPPESPLPESKKRPNAVLDAKPEEGRQPVETLAEHRITYLIKHSTGKGHMDHPRKSSKTNQPSTQSSNIFNGPRVSKSATPLTSSTSRQRYQLTKKPSRRPSIPIRRSNHHTKTPVLRVHNHEITLKREDNPRVDAEFIGRRASSAVERASAAEVDRRGGSVVGRTSASEAKRMRSNAAVGERSAARSQNAVVPGPMQDVEVRQVKKPRSMQAELRRLFGL